MFDYIQIITILVAVVVIVNLFILFRRGDISARRLGGWVVLWALVVLFVSYPGLTDEVALFLGIDRGTDAAFFGAIVLIFYIMLKIFTRLEKMEKNLTKIVREIAIRDSENGPEKA